VQRQKNIPRYSSGNIVPLKGHAQGRRMRLDFDFRRMFPYNGRRPLQSAIDRDAIAIAECQPKLPPFCPDHDLVWRQVVTSQSRPFLSGPDRILLGLTANRTASSAICEDSFSGAVIIEFQHAARRLSFSTHTLQLDPTTHTSAFANSRCA